MHKAEVEARAVGPQAAERGPPGMEGGVTDGVRRLVCARRAGTVLSNRSPGEPGDYLLGHPWAEGETVGDPETPGDAENCFDGDCN